MWNMLDWHNDKKSLIQISAFAGFYEKHCKKECFDKFSCILETLAQRKLNGKKIFFQISRKCLSVTNTDYVLFNRQWGTLPKTDSQGLIKYHKWDKKRITSQIEAITNTKPKKIVDNKEFNLNIFLTPPTHDVERGMCERDIYTQIVCKKGSRFFNVCNIDLISHEIDVFSQQF